MSLMWREQLSVGNDVIDSDHRYLIEIINRVERCLNNRSRSELFVSLDNLAQYSREHFAREERIAHAVGYEQLPNLNESHERLFKQLDELKQELHGMGDEWSPAVIEHFIALLRSWLIDHVIKEDLLMKPALQKYSPAFDPR